MKLLREASRENILLIEDDYNSEFCYVHHPAPSIQGLAGGEGVVYLGTFSRMLLPSIRLSFMVLPSDLLEQYEKRKDFYNQTASKAEQIALCQFIRDGHLESQIRKARKYYQAKSKLLCQEAQRIFGDRAEQNTEFWFCLPEKVTEEYGWHFPVQRFRQKNFRRHLFF